MFLLTLCTQSFMAVSPMHLSSALADRTRMKLCALCTLWISLSSNLPASSFSTSIKTLYPLTCRCTFRRLENEVNKQIAVFSNNLGELFWEIPYWAIPGQLGTSGPTVADEHVRAWRLGVCVARL